MTTQTFGIQELYARDGYVIFRDVLDAELIAEAQAHVEWLRRKHPDLRPENLHHGLVAEDAFWMRLVSDERLLDIAEQFIGPNIALFASHYIAKPPRTGLPVKWHQDGSYWPLEPMEVTTLWLAVSDSTPENGCMRVLPGTQDMDLSELRKSEEGTNALDREMDVSGLDESTAVDFVLKAGDVSVHNPAIVHGSNANTSDSWRLGLTIRYIPTSTRIVGEQAGRGVFLMRGEAVTDANPLLKFPRYIEGEHVPFRDAEAWNERHAVDA